MARLMPPAAWWLIGVFILVLAFAARVAVHAGRTPGGVDTWYYLAYADAVRRRPSIDVRLPRYLLQDERQSYPPLFPSLLALLPGPWLRRFYWLVSPMIDCAHLVLLYWVSFRLTDNVVVAAIAAATYAFTPHLISETRSLSARPFGALLHSVTMIALLKFTVTTPTLPWALVAALLASLLFLSSAAMAAALVFVTAALAVVFRAPAFVLLVAAGLGLAFALSGGHMRQVVRNYAHAIAYWRRNRAWFGAHPVQHSPVFRGSARPPTVAQRPGFLGKSTVQQIVRLLGENPFLLALPFVPVTPPGWASRLYWWAVALAAFAVIATVLPPLRAFGPGRSYMKAAIFPTAYTIAAGIGTTEGLGRPLGLVTMGCLGASLAAIAFFYVAVRRKPTEQTASIPDGLAQAVRALSAQPPGGVFVLPYMYADFVGYASGRPVVWGGHCGDLRRFEWIAPRIVRPLDDLFDELSVRYVLLDERFVKLPELALSGRAEAIWRSADFVIYRFGR
jgi:hypothetical protein